MSTNDENKVNHSVTADVVSPAKTAGMEEPTKTPAKTPSKGTAKSPGGSPKVSYIQLVHEAIVALKDRTGSSQIAIQKHISATHPEIDAKKLKQRLSLTLKAGLKGKRFVKFKASYKIHPDAKKKPKKKKNQKSKSKSNQKLTAKKKELTPAQLAAQREKERQAAKEKARQERIRKRKFPMDDLKLIAEDKELRVSVSLPSRPRLPLVFPECAAACKSDSMGSGLMEDVLQIYHFFRGDVGWKRKDKNVVAPFTLEQWLACVQLILKGNAKKIRMVPPLMSHLFVVALQHLVPSKLQVGLTPSSWSEILLLYMDAMDRYYATEASEVPSALPGLTIDTEYLLGVTDEPNGDIAPVEKPQSSLYLQGNLRKAHSKLLTHDPWMFTAEELVSLLRALCDDLLEDCSSELEDRLMESYELFKRKRAADAALRKLQITRNKEQNEEKEREASDEKATRSNTKLPTVSEGQLESARRAQQKHTDAYEKFCKERRIRTDKIGEDRHFNSVYHFSKDPNRVFVLQKGKRMPCPASFSVPDLEIFRTTWYSMDQRSMVEKYIDSLDVRGKREIHLHEVLQPARKLVHDDIKVLNDQKSLLREKQEAQRKLEIAKLKCEFGRKSGRLAAQSEQEFSALLNEIESLEETIAGRKVPIKVDLAAESGMHMLKEFDEQGTHNERRRATRRDTQKQQAEEIDEKLPTFQCSRLWASGNIDGTGVVGSIVWDLLELEERVDLLASWEDENRQNWISNLETAAHLWYEASPPLLGEDDTLTPVSSPEDGSSAKKLRLADTPGSVGSSTSKTTPTLSQTLSMLKQPLLELEKRIFEITGLAMAASDADQADDNMSSSPEEDKEEKLQLAWKKIIYRLHRLPAKAHSRIRQLVVEAIAAARKAQQAVVVAQLREALLQFHPQSAGSCKISALEILEQHGGYDDFDDEDEEDEDGDEAEDEAKEGYQFQPETGISSVLCAEAVILNSSLDGQEDASRGDWITAVKKTRTLSKFAALSAAFVAKASTKLDKLESEQDTLRHAIDAWVRASSSRNKKKSTKDISEPSEVWTNVTFTDDFCLAKVDKYPWWPAKKCVVKEEELAQSLESVGRCLVSLVGELGGLRVIKTESLLPFSETLPEDEALSNHSKEMRTQLDECMAMARRIIRGKEKKAARASKKKKKSITSYTEFKEEKKLAT